MKPNAVLAADPAPIPGGWTAPFEDSVDAVLQFDFDAVPELPKKRSSWLEWKPPEKATSIKEAIAGWLDERL